MGKKPAPPPDLVPGTLEMLILKTLTHGPMHGYGIAQRLEQLSEGVLQVGEGSLYPALQRLLLNEWAEAEWAVTENNRRARYYRITAAGRRRLAQERAGYDRMSVAIARIMEAV
ncbi:PadR family transcriptional regulator [uncultured Paludibaculum sp.]|uniref:PadR family transcriptional regulator n=1 Tax=uncultured Paludibaculum sp. TaxID=1765020 RepID=UPI002AAB89E2|nr:PadR family transcriptional regulator [uncultured Paludibaculum sp.]